MPERIFSVCLVSIVRRTTEYEVNSGVHFSFALVVGNVLCVQIVDKVGDDVDDNMQEVDQDALEKIKVTVSPSLSPREKQLQDHIYMK